MMDSSKPIRKLTNLFSLASFSVATFFHLSFYCYATPDLRGEFSGSVENVISNCTESEIDGAYFGILRISIDLQNGDDFTGTGEATYESGEQQATEHIQLIGKINVSGEITGQTTHTFLGTLGEGIFEGQLTESMLSIVNTGYDTISGDGCSSSCDVEPLSSPIVFERHLDNSLVGRFSNQNTTLAYQRVANRLALDADRTIDAAHWWGYLESNIASTNADFRIQFYDDDVTNGVPGNLLATAYVTPRLEDTGLTQVHGLEDVSVYEVSTELSVDRFLAIGERAYWIEIAYLPSTPNDEFLWARASTSDGAIAYRNGDRASWSLAGGHDPAFYLQSNSVPDPVSLDVDGDGAVTVETDGALILGHLFGFAGTVLTANATSTTSTRTTEQIAQHLDQLLPHLDVDGDGKADALSDGILILRYLSGVRESELTDAVVSPSASRNSGIAIIDYIEQHFLIDVGGAIWDNSKWDQSTWQ